MRAFVFFLFTQPDTQLDRQTDRQTDRILGRVMERIVKGHGILFGLWLIPSMRGMEVNMSWAPI